MAWLRRALSSAPLPAWWQQGGPPVRAVVVSKWTLLDDAADSRTPEQPRALVDDPGVRRAHAENRATLEHIAEELGRSGLAVRVVGGMNAPEPEDVAWADLVVTVGGDGTFLRATHRMADRERTLVMGVNSAPSSSVGYFCATDGAGFPALLRRLLRGQLVPSPLWRMRVAVNGTELPQLALNDVLVSASVPASTSRYTLRASGGPPGGQTQISSGVWVSTAAGSTAAMRAAGGVVYPVTECVLQYRVRELYQHTGAGGAAAGAPLLGGPVDDHFSLQSRMPSGGLFVDGQAEMVPLRFGDVARFMPSTAPLRWVAPSQEAPRC